VGGERKYTAEIEKRERGKGKVTTRRRMERSKRESRMEGRKEARK
jgi:hypothetical protein